jgi:hypothetical protein
MTYFEELTTLPEYQRDDFHFDYNTNKGGGQADLAGKFKNKEGLPTPLVTLAGKRGVFKYAFKSPIQGATAVTMIGEDVAYQLKRRSKTSTGIRLMVGRQKPNPSRALTAFFMLPAGCTVKKSAYLTCSQAGPPIQQLTCSVLAKGNYWLQSMRLDYEEDHSQQHIAYLIPSDLVFSGGFKKVDAESVDEESVGEESVDEESVDEESVDEESVGEESVGEESVGEASKVRHFRLDSDRRIRDIVAISKNEFLPTTIRELLQFFAEIYVGTRAFSFEEAEKATDTLMLETVRHFPAVYSGIDDPLPVLVTMTRSRRDGTVTFRTGLDNPEKRNIVIFGAPGTGKSKLLDQKKDTLLGDGGEFERVTFHPDYSYAHFVGTYKPVPTEGAEGRETITYKYVAGPFMRVLAAALRSGTTENPKPHLLLIEEINRASPSAVFGDVFQLLDRNGYNVSEYPIHASADVRTYLAETVGGQPSDYKELRIPDNMFIWGSMNSADQGVFPMDTAFKRRWDFVYIGINDSEADLVGKHVTLGHGDSAHTVQWNDLRKSINDFLADKGINEDKQLGPFFLGREVAVPADGNQIDREVFIAAFKQKVLMYLFEDAARQHRKALFEGCGPNANRYSDICRDFDRVGIDVFHRQISGRVLKTSNSRQENRDEAALLGSRQE